MSVDDRPNRTRRLLQSIRKELPEALSADLDHDDAEIAAVFRHEPDAQAAADRLVELALAKGGADNVTVQVIGYRGPGRGGTRLRRADFLAVLLTSLVVSSTTVVVGQHYRLFPSGGAAAQRCAPAATLAAP